MQTIEWESMQTYYRMGEDADRRMGKDAYRRMGEYADLL